MGLSEVTRNATFTSGAEGFTSSVTRLVALTLKRCGGGASPSSGWNSTWTFTDDDCGLSTANCSSNEPVVEPSGRNHSLAGAATAEASKPARPLSKYTARSATIG